MRNGAEKAKGKNTVYIHQHYKVQAAKVALEALGFKLYQSANSRGDMFWEVSDSAGKNFATTLHDSELCQFLSDVLLCTASNVTPELILKNRSL